MIKYIIMRHLSICVFFVCLCAFADAADLNLQITGKAAPVIPERSWEEYQTLAGAVKENTALDVKSYGEEGSQYFYIRGYNKGVQVYLDGAPLPTDITGLTDVSLIPVSIIDRVEVSQGFNPASPQGTGSVYIYTKKPVDGSSVFDVSSYIATNNTNLFSLGLRGSAADKVPYRISYAKNSSDGFQYHSSYDKNALNIEFEPLKNQNISYIYLNNNSDLSDGTSVPVSEWNGKKERQPNSYSDYLDDTMHQIAFNGKADKFAYGASYGHLLREGLSYGDFTRITNQEYSSFAEYAANEFFTFGAAYKHSSIDTNGTYYNKNSYDWDIASLYAKTALKTDIADAELSARYDYHTFWDNNFSYKAKISKGEKTKVFTAFSSSKIYPSVADYDKHIGGLEPEKSFMLEAGLEGNYIDFNFALSPFVKYIDDKINLINVGGGWDYYATNAGKARIYGLEMQATKTIDIYRATAIYTLADNRIKPFGSGDYLRSQFAPVSVFKLINTLNAGSFKFIATLLAQSSYYSQNGHEGDNLPGYADISFTVEKKTGPAVIFADISNILDRHYAINGAYGTFYPDPGRTLKLGVKYQYSK